MNGIIYFLLIIIIIGGILGIVYTIGYNNLQDCKVKIDEAENQIDEYLRQKYDLLTRINSLLEGTLKKDKLSLKGLDKLKEEEISNFDLERKLNEYMLLVNKIRNDYTELQENKDLKELIHEIKLLEEKLEATKTFYNKYTSLSNEYVRKIPTNFIAKTTGIKVRKFYDNKDRDDEIINDFKL